MNGFFPFYDDDNDYNVNAPSFYDYLARNQKLLKKLAERIWEYDKELAKRFEEWDKNLEEFPDDVKDLLVEWLNNGTLEQIINDDVLGNKADQSELDITVNDLNERYVNVKNPPAPYVRAFGDNETDDTQAIQAIMNDFDNVYFPDGEYNVTGSIKVRDYMKIVGNRGRSFLTSKTKDIIILMGDSEIDSTTGFSHSVISGLSVEGSKDLNQTGFQLRGYHSKIKNSVIKNLGIGLVAKGVVVDYDSLFIFNNKTGVLIGDTDVSFNTMLAFKHVDIHGNDNGLKLESDNNVVLLSFDHVVFEKNRGRAFEGKPFSASFNECWFERNEERPIISNQRILFNRNRFERAAGYPDQSFEFYEGDYEGAWATRGHVEVGEKSLSTLQLDLQSYGLYGVKNPNTSLSISNSGGTAHLQIGHEDDSPTEFPITSMSRNTKKMVRLQITPNGTVSINDFQHPDVNITVTKKQVGEYLINFGRTFAVEETPVIQVMPPASTGNAGGIGNTFYHTTLFRSTGSVSAYPRYNEMIIKVFERPFEDEKTDTLQDGYINLTFFASL